MTDYEIKLDDKYGQLSLIDVAGEAAAHAPWFEVEGSDTVRLRPHQGYTVPSGTMHKTSAPERTVIVMVESAGVVPTGD